MTQTRGRVDGVFLRISEGVSRVPVSLRRPELGQLAVKRANRKAGTQFPYKSHSVEKSLHGYIKSLILKVNTTSYHAAWNSLTSDPSHSIASTLFSCNA